MGDYKNVSIRDHYQRVIREIMEGHGILPGRPWFGHVVPPNASFKEVVKYTDYYIGKGNYERYGYREHHRYERYLNSMRALDEGLSEKRRVNVDIGCGAGLFSWAFLDRATESEIGFDHINLFGLDHSAAMIRLAQEIRSRLMQVIPCYPTLSYYLDSSALFDALREFHRDEIDYVITFGYVLAQTHNSEVINKFADIIRFIKVMTAEKSDCFVVAVDTNTKAPSAFEQGWESLLSQLGNYGVNDGCRCIRVTGDGAKIIWV